MQGTNDVLAVQVTDEIREVSTSKGVLRFQQCFATLRGIEHPQMFDRIVNDREGPLAAGMYDVTGQPWLGRNKQGYPALQMRIDFRPHQAKAGKVAAA